MSDTSYKIQLSKHIPDLWRYSLRLCASEDAASNLLRDTLDMAIHKQWKRPEETPLYTWLSRMMYRIFVTDYYAYSRRQARAVSGTFRFQFVPPSCLTDPLSMDMVKGTASVH